MKNLTFIILLLANFSLFAQNTYVPDDNFEQALIDLGYDSGALDDYVPTANISGVTYLNLSSKNISDLTGIEDFAALTYLFCYHNQLSSLDVSANTALTNLFCPSNQLTSLDVSANSALTYLYCYHNQLSSLDVSANTALTNLNCYENQLTSLDVSTNTALTGLYCFENQLTSLDVSANTALTQLSCYSNQLTSLDVSANAALTELYCHSNQLTSLNVSANTDLEYLNCGSNQLTSLDIRNGNNANLTYLIAASNPDLSCIYVDDNTVSYSGWSKDETAIYVNNESECSGFTYVPDDNFEQALIDLGYDSGAIDDYVPTANITVVTNLSVSSKNISDLTGIEDFAALEYLDCYSNQLTSLDVSANTALTELYCHSNQLTSLNVSANTDLEYLNCGSNQLTSLDVRNGNNANLTYLIAASNPDLTCIYVDDNTVSYSGWSKDETAIYVNNESECSGFTYVPDDNFEQALIDKGYDSGALDNYVPTANISGVTSLNIGLKNISDLTGIEDFAALTYLFCYSNQLSSLDVSANTALTYLFCSSNQLTSLDVSANTALTYLYCSSNQLTSLDIRNGNNANLTYLNATSNPDLRCIYVDDNTVSYPRWYKDETATYVNNEAECTALNGFKNASEEETTTYVNDKGEDVSEFSLFPNPVKEQFTIQTNEKLESLKLYNISGSLVKEFNVQDTYSVSDLPAGVYYLNITCKKETFTHKLVIE